MIGLGTIINVGAILIGGLMGLFVGRSVEVRYQDILMISVGVCVMMLGIGGTMKCCPYRMSRLSAAVL